MIRWFTHAFVAFITFAISVFGTLLFLIVTGNQPQPVNAPSCPEESAPKSQERTDDSSVRSPYETMAFTSPNPGTAQSVRADKHPSFASIVTTMRTLVQLKKNRSGHNTVYISNVSTENGYEFAYAYWKEDKSITSLQLPLTLPVLLNSPTYYWLTTKARIDLVTDVVPTEKDIGGSSFLVDRPWANKIIRNCLNGVRLRF